MKQTQRIPPILWLNAEHFLALRHMEINAAPVISGMH
jgi:hypothetical protein